MLHKVWPPARAGIVRKYARNADSQALPQNNWLRISILIRFPREKHCSEGNQSEEWKITIFNKSNNSKQIYSPYSMHACSVAQSCLTLSDSTDFSPPGSSVHGITQARILEWVAISFSRGSSQPWNQTHISCLSGTAGRFFTTESSGKAYSYPYTGLIIFIYQLIWSS